MSDNKTLPQGGRENRTTERYSLRHRLNTTFKEKELPGEIVDWSQNGMQVYVKVPLDEQIEYKVVFRIQRHYFVADEDSEEDETLLPIIEYEEEDEDFPPVEEWEGKVLWTRQIKNWVAIGIGFEEGLEEVPFMGSHRYITQRDLCHLWVFPKNEEQ